MDLKVIQPIESVKENLPLTGKMPAEPKQYEAPETKLSENIQKFDKKKPKVFPYNPYSYNSVSLKKDPVSSISAEQMITDPLYNRAGKVLGVDTIHEWNKYANKVKEIVDWAKEETGYTDNGRLLDWIYSQMGKVSNLGNKKIDDVYIYSKIKAPEKPKTIVKTVVKKVYVKEKLSDEEFAKRFIKSL